MLLYSGAFIKDNPDAGRRFMRAYVRAIRDCNDALKDGKIAGPNATIKDPAVYRAITPQGCNPDGRVNEASLKKDLKFYQEDGLVKGNATVEQAVDNSFVEAALKDLGPYKPMAMAGKK